jgi:hypothetical protein
MIAYGYFIKFFPPLKRKKSVSGLKTQQVTVRRAASDDKRKKLACRLEFINNQGRDLALYSDRGFAASDKNQLWAFEVEGVLTFYWQHGSLILEYVEHENFTEALLEYWTLHSVLPIFFTIEGIYDFLHAGAVEVEGKPILFIAESFGGKSTITDYFMRRGHAMVADDGVATYRKGDLFHAVPSHPYHRPHRGREDLGIFVDNMAREAKPIGAVYALEKKEPAADVDIVPLHGIEKFKVLGYSSMINLSPLKPGRFHYLSQLGQSVPVCRVSIPWDRTRLGQVYDRILADMMKQE